MKSPFPGMDPYLEQYWQDIHHALCTYARDQLQPQLQPALRARLDERVVVESGAGDPRPISPDVKIVQRRGHGDSATAVLAESEAAEPVLYRVEGEPITEGFIQIIDTTTGGTLVTVIEFLSTSNKFAGKGQKQYLLKQEELYQASVSLVEIDLLRSGDWVFRLPMSRVTPELRAPHRVCVHRGWTLGDYEYYALPLQKPLPKIRIPLRRNDRDATLDLQAMVDLAYRNGAYDDIDYRKPAVPPLEGELDRWADELLRSAGRR